MRAGIFRLSLIHQRCMTRAKMMVPAVAPPRLTGVGPRFMDGASSVEGGAEGRNGEDGCGGRGGRDGVAAGVAAGRGAHQADERPDGGGEEECEGGHVNLPSACAG